MKDFDEARKARLERDRSFIIGGETLTYRPAVAPEALLHYNSALTGDATLSEQDWIDLYDEAIIALLEEGQANKWKKVRNPNVENPLNASDINELLQWLLEEQSGRPTGQPSDSSSSTDGNGTQSTVASSPPPAEPQPVSASEKSAT